MFDLIVLIKIKVGPTGRAIGLEHIDDLVKKSIKNINSWNPHMIESGQIKMISKLLNETNKKKRLQIRL